MDGAPGENRTKSTSDVTVIITVIGRTEPLTPAERRSEDLLTPSDHRGSITPPPARALPQLPHRTPPRPQRLHKREPCPSLSNPPSSVASSHPLLSDQSYRRRETTPMSRDWSSSVWSSTVTVPVVGSPSSSDPRKGQARSSHPSLPLRLSVSRSFSSTLVFHSRPQSTSFALAVVSHEE